MKKVLFYTNQFFGQVGGEEFAYTKPFMVDGPKGNANAFAPKLVGGEIVATIVCGDNYYAENMDEAIKFIRAKMDEVNPDLVIAGPAFNAGRFGVACGDVCKFATENYGIPAITGLYIENPAVEMYKQYSYIMKVGKSAASIRKAVPLITNFVNKIIAGKELGSPIEEHYYPKGIRKNIISNKKGSERAVEMLINKLYDKEFTTELEISAYEKVDPAPGLGTLEGKKIAICTSGGIVLYGNPDRMPAASAKIYKNYDIKGKDSLEEGKFESVHAGYDPVYANKDPNRIAPLNTLRDLEKEGKIGNIHNYLVSTTGNSTSVANATRMGQEISNELLSAGVDGVILTST